MKDSTTSKPKRKKITITNPNEEELQKKYGYSSFHLTTEQYLRKLSLSLLNIAGGMGSLKKGVIS